MLGIIIVMNISRVLAPRVSRFAPEAAAAKVTAMAVTAPMVVPAATAMVTATTATAPPAAATGLNFLRDEGKARH
jgi:hypothetical protein